MFLNVNPEKKISAKGHNSASTCKGQVITVRDYTPTVDYVLYLSLFCLSFQHITRQYTFWYNEIG